MVAKVGVEPTWPNQPTDFKSVVYTNSTTSPNGTLGETRTHNPRFRRPMLYPFELQEQVFF